MYQDIIYECKSRSGLINSSNESTFNVICSGCMNILYDYFLKLADDNISLEEYKQSVKDDFINNFMIILHKGLVEPKKFNWD